MCVWTRTGRGGLVGGCWRREEQRERERSRDWERGERRRNRTAITIQDHVARCSLQPHPTGCVSVRFWSKKPWIQSQKTSKLPSTHLPPGGEGAAAAASPASLALCSDSRTAAAPGKVSAPELMQAGSSCLCFTLSCAFKPSWSCVFTSCQARCCYGVFTGTKHWCLLAQNGSLLLTLKEIYRHVQ